MPYSVPEGQNRSLVARQGSLSFLGRSDKDRVTSEMMCRSGWRSGASSAPDELSIGRGKNL